MNITELARRLRTNPDEVREKLPLLGFDVGNKAIKVDDRLVPRIMDKWGEMRKLDRLKQKYQQEEKAKEEAIARVKQVALPRVLTVRDFASRLTLPLNIVIGELMKNGILASVNERIDYDTACIVAQDLGYEVTEEAKEAEVGTGLSADDLKEALGNEDEAKLKPRPPVVVVMGHVDHGKTMLLDAIRKTNVLKTEAGGITQHIGAYQVEKKGRKITFIDTPGHEAFTIMRSRGARVADVAIIVVAADDGVQPQTIEVIKIVQAAKLPFVVALNKMDKPTADPQRVKAQLTEYGLVAEDWGGSTIFVPISAKAGDNLDQLLDMVLLVADMDKDKIRANPERRAVGTIVEARVDKGEGPVATLLVQAGTLRRNDILAVGDMAYGRVRAMKDHLGKLVEKVGPGTPVRVLGFKVAPQVGDIVEVPEPGKELQQARKAYGADRQNAPTSAAVTEDGQERKWLNVVLKADVLGSLEAIVGTLEKMVAPEVGVKVISKGLGNVTENDVAAAEAAGGVVFGFNVLMTKEAELAARNRQVPALSYRIIYEMFDEAKRRLQELLPAETVTTKFGKLKVLALFRGDQKGQVVGGLVTDGKLVNGTSVVVFRDGVPVGEGKLVQLQSGKTDVKEVHMGQECGLRMQVKGAIQVDDIIENFTVEKKERKLELPG